MIERVDHQDYTIFKPDLVELLDQDGNKVYISPLHSKYKELRELESNRRTEETNSI